MLSLQHFDKDFISKKADFMSAFTDCEGKYGQFYVEKICCQAAPAAAHGENQTGEIRADGRVETASGESVIRPVP